MTEESRAEMLEALRADRIRRNESFIPKPPAKPAKPTEPGVIFRTVFVFMWWLGGLFVLALSARIFLWMFGWFS